MKWVWMYMKWAADETWLSKEKWMKMFYIDAISASSYLDSFCQTVLKMNQLKCCTVADLSLSLDTVLALCAQNKHDINCSILQHFYEFIGAEQQRWVTPTTRSHHRLLHVVLANDEADLKSWDIIMNTYVHQFVQDEPTSNFQFEHIEAEKNGHHFSDNIFKYIFLNEIVWISLKFVSKLQTILQLWFR